MICCYKIPESLSKRDASSKLVGIVNSAIGGVVAESPTLRAGITGENSNSPTWIELEGVDLEKHIRWTDVNDNVDGDGQIQATVQSEIDMRFFDLDVRPGWRVVVMQHNVHVDNLNILFVWNHPHADGMSGKIFHQLLLEALRKTTNTYPQQILDKLTLACPDTSQIFPPATETMVKLSTTPLFVLKEAWDDYKPPSLFPKPTQADWAPIRPLPYKTRFLVFTLSNTTLSRILTACRAKDTTLTALLNSLALISLATRIASKEAPAFASSTALDQRRFIPTQPPEYPWFHPNTAIGNYVSIMTHEYAAPLVATIRRSKQPSSTNGDLLDTDLQHILWFTATRVRSEIQHRLDMGLHNDTLGLARFVPNWKKQFLSDVKKPRKLSWFVTNLGVFEGGAAKDNEKEEGEEKGWEIQRAQFTLSTEIPVAALLIGVASVKGGDVVVTCTWQDTVIDEGFVGGVMGDLERWLGQVGGE